MILGLVHSAEVKAESKVESKRSTSEFFTNLFMEQAPGLGGASAGQAAAGSSNSTANSSADSQALNSTTGNLENWLMVSSKTFSNSQKFPPVMLWSGQSVEIKADPYYFRINSGYVTGQNSTTNPPTDKYFWFRLGNNTNIYYSSTASDLNVLGAIAVRIISSILTVSTSTGDGVNCFTVRDYENNDWKLCAETDLIRKRWVCRLQVLLNLTQSDFCSGGDGDDISKVRTITKIQPMIIVPIPSPFCNENWNYQQHGHDWNCDCAEGRAQSPINLPKKEEAIDSPIKPMFMYEEVAVKSPISTIDGQLTKNENLKFRLADNNLKIMHKNFGKLVTIDGAVYHAQEVIVHTPAEHKIDGKTYDMEVQIIHYGQTKGDIAKQVVLSFLFEKKPGVYNKFLDDLDIFNLPNPLTKEVDLSSNIFIPKILYTSDDTDVPMMKPFSFYTYTGSLTFPPCTENTIMYIASKPLQIGTTALQLFQEALRVPDIIDTNGNVITSNWIPETNRDLQDVNGRPIFHYDHEKYCGPDPVKKPLEPAGHYEKIEKKLTKYFYVSNMTPSGIPGSLVVPDKEALGNGYSLRRS